MINPAHNHRNYHAFLAHRISGVLLTLFLPFHFWALSRAINGPQALQGFIQWTDNPYVHAAETGLVVLLAVHLTGGLRLLALEFLPWRPWQKNAVALSGAISLIVGLLFLLNVM
ncbi:MAG: succinate dehydrogenase, cytochrome b556 subunit [Acidiferrobacteraceae bacterium]